MLSTKREQNRNNSSVLLACENVWETLGVAGRMWGHHRNDKNRKDSVLYIAFIWIVVWKHHFKSPYLSWTVSQKIVVNLSDYIWPQHVIWKVNSDLLLHRTSCARYCQVADVRAHCAAHVLPSTSPTKDVLFRQMSHHANLNKMID